MNEDELAAGLAETPGYRYAELEGDQLFVAGQVPLDSSGNLIGTDDAAVQATACLDNLRTLLSLHDFKVDDVRRLVVYVVGGHQNLADAWAAATGWFPNEVPPATLLGVNLLGHAGQLVEVDRVDNGPVCGRPSSRSTSAERLGSSARVWSHVGTTSKATAQSTPSSGPVFSAAVRS